MSAASLSSVRLPSRVMFLPLPFVVSIKPAVSSCCRIFLMLAPPPFLACSRMAPLRCLPPYSARSLSMPIGPCVYVFLSMDAALVNHQSGSSGWRLVWLLVLAVVAHGSGCTWSMLSFMYLARCCM